jgi:hypothetical protein
MEVSSEFQALLLYFPSVHWKRGWVGPRTDLDVVARDGDSKEERKLCPSQGSNPDCATHSLVTTLTATLQIYIYIYIYIGKVVPCV